MVSLSLSKRLAELEAKAKTPSQQTEVLAILRQRLADPALTGHKRELMQMALRQSHAMTFGLDAGGVMYGNS